MNPLKRELIFFIICGFIYPCWWVVVALPASRFILILIRMIHRFYISTTTSIL